MTLFSDPNDLLALALFALTLAVVIPITLAKDMTRREKYGALALTFLFSAIVDGLAIYSLVAAIAFCLLMAAIFSLLWLRTRRQMRSRVSVTFLPESKTLPPKTIRLLGRG